MAIEASEILGVDADKREVWEAKQSQLDPIIIGEEGQVKEWFEESRLGYGQVGDLPETGIPNFGEGGSANAGSVHRHTSQLIGLYPGTLINKASENTGYWDGFEPGKMIDGDSSSRWASKDDNGEPIELQLDFDSVVTFSRLNFDVFVSGHNKIGAYEIQALTDGTYKTVCEGEALADGSDDVGGNHGFASVTFDTITTNSLKVILKEGYQEPSIWEINPLLFGEIADQPGDPAELDAVIAQAEDADRTSEDYINAEVDAKTAMLLEVMQEMQAEKGELKEVYRELKDMSQGNITDQSWEDFQNLLKEAETI